MSPETVVRRGSWVTLALSALFLASTLINPVGGAALAVLFFALGWGMRRHQVWAATAVSVLLIAEIFLQIYTRWNAGHPGSLAFSVALQAAIATLPIWAAATLWRHREMARFGLGWLAVFTVVLLCAVGLRPYALSSGSMANTLQRGDYVLSDHLRWKLGRTPHDGDIVEVRYPVNPQQRFIKRVVGVPGDRLHLVNKQLYRNGVLVEEPYAIHSTAYVDPYRDNFPGPAPAPLPPQAFDMLEHHVSNGEVVVPPGCYFVLGDNRDDSLDSRYWGFVTRAEIVGSPFVIYASYNLPPANRRATYTILNTRWNRLLKGL